MILHYSFINSKAEINKNLPTCAIQYPELEKNYLISKLQSGYIIVKEESFQLTKAVFGLLPQICKVKVNKGNLINAYAETVMTQRSFRMSIRNKRCLIPADSFYICNVQKNNAYRFYEQKNQVMFYAGVYDEVVLDSGKIMRTFSLITRSRSSATSERTYRIPLILNKLDQELWMSKKTSLSEVQELLLKPNTQHFYLKEQEIDPQLLIDNKNEQSYKELLMLR